MLDYIPPVVLSVFLFLLNLELFSGKKKKKLFVPLFFVCKCAIILDFLFKKTKTKNTTVPLFKLLNCHLPESRNSEVTYWVCNYSID